MITIDHGRAGNPCITQRSIGRGGAGDGGGRGLEPGGFFTRPIPLDAWTILFWRGLFGGFFIGSMSSGATVPAPGGDPGHGLARAAGHLLSTIGMTTFIPALKLTSVADVAIVFATCPFVAAAFA